MGGGDHEGTCRALHDKGGDRLVRAEDMLSRLAYRQPAEQQPETIDVPVIRPACPSARPARRERAYSVSFAYASRAESLWSVSSACGTRFGKRGLPFHRGGSSDFILCAITRLRCSSIGLMPTAKRCGPASWCRRSGSPGRTCPASRPATEGSARRGTRSAWSGHGGAASALHHQTGLDRLVETHVAGDQQIRTGMDRARTTGSSW